MPPRPSRLTPSRAQNMHNPAHEENPLPTGPHGEHPPTRFPPQGSREIIYILNDILIMASTAYYTVPVHVPCQHQYHTYCNHVFMRIATAPVSIANSPARTSYHMRRRAHAY
eukprot:5646160-Prymnesium_polylepis.1